MSRERERYEDRRIAPAAIGPGTAWAMIVAAVLMLLATPLHRVFDAGHADVFAAWRAPQEVKEEGGPDDGGPRAANRALLHRLEEVESALESGSALRAAVLPTVQWALLRFGGAGNETVYIAGPRPTWLTLRTGFDHTTGPAFLDPGVLERRRRADPDRPGAFLGKGAERPGHPDPIPALLDFHRQLESRGVALLFVPVPSKAAVVPEALGARRVPGRMARNPSSEPLLERLRGAGALVFDPGPLLAELGQGAYLRTDSHWSPAAVDAVAAALVGELERFELGPRLRDWLREPVDVTGRGDLWRALSLPPGRPLFAEETVQVQQVTSWDGLLWQPVPGAPVLLLGDSFSTVYSDENLFWGAGAGLAEQLAFHLGRDVDRLARPDGASDQVRQDLARRPERLDGVKVVVYQVATRELSVGDWPITGHG